MEVFTQTGFGGCDLMDLSKQQVIDYLLERYEVHLICPTFSMQTDTVSMSTPRMSSHCQPSAESKDGARPES